MLGGEPTWFGNENKPSSITIDISQACKKQLCNGIHLQQMDNFVIGKKSRESNSGQMAKKLAPLPSDKRISFVAQPPPSENEASKASKASYIAENRRPF